MPLEGNIVLVRSLERPPSTLWLLSRPLKSISSPCFKTQSPSVLPPSFWFTNWRLYQGRRHVTYYWSAAAPHSSWVWQTLDTWNPEGFRPKEVLPSWSLSRCSLAGGQLSTVRCGRSGGQQSVCFIHLVTFSPRTYRHICSLPDSCGLASCRHHLPIRSSHMAFQSGLDI